MLLEAIPDALAALMTAERLTYMVIGVFTGLFIGVLPGLGGTVGMSILLPFVFGMDPTTGMALLIGFAAVTHVSDTFPSVLLGIPGSSGSQATIVDGYPMAQRGEAARALGASFTASMAGGIVGALSIILLIFIARPIILSLGSPELFMLCLLGLSMVAILSKGLAYTGLVSAALGLLIGAIGVAPAHPTYRFTFEWSYLQSGIPIPIVALGLFAIPEMVDMLARRRSVSGSASMGKGMLSGMAEALRHRGLLLRSSLVGTGIGMVPGLGGAVVDWVAYGLAARTSKHSEGFGKGDIRGVIAPESANNAKDAGTLIPTLFFGIPGSGTTAILLGGLMLMGLQPGPAMVDEHLDVTLATVWTLVLATTLACILCLLLARYIARIAQVPMSKLFPFLFIIMAIAALQATQHWGDLVVFFVLGLLGYLMKVTHIPRPPLLIGFILATSLERYLHLSMSRYDFEWLLFPGVLAIAAFILIVTLLPSVLKRIRTARSRTGNLR